MHFGFSYVGLIYLVMLMLPNILWTKNQPKDYDKYARNENKILLALERIGEVLVSCAALVFSDFNIKPWSPWSLWLVASFVLMVLYEVFWIRYFRSEKTMKDFSAASLVFRWQARRFLFWLSSYWRYTVKMSFSELLLSYWESDILASI